MQEQEKIRTQTEKEFQSKMAELEAERQRCVTIKLVVASYPVLE